MIIKNMNVKNVEMNERDKEVMKNGDTDQGYYLMTAKNQKNKSNGQVKNVFKLEKMILNRKMNH